MPIDEKTKAYLLLQKIKAHFKNHYYFTTDDLEQFEREIYCEDIRRGLIEIESGKDMIHFNHIDLP